METAEKYFGRPDTPMANSPTALAMCELLKICPQLSFEAAREAVNDVGAAASRSAKQCAQAALRMIQSQSTTKAAA